MNVPSVIALVLNYGRAHDTIECVRSLRASTYPSLEIVVIDNGSPDDSEAEIRRACPGIDVVQTGKNLGYAGGMNVGIQRASKHSPNYLLLLNSDTILDKGCIRLLVEALENNLGAGAASGTIFYYPDEGKVWYAGGTMNFWRASAFTNHDVDKSSDIAPVSFVSGCTMLIRTAVLNEIGLFDERFFMYLEDTELCARLLANNYKILYVHDAKIFHKVFHEGDLPLPLYFSIRNRLLFLKISATGVHKFVGYSYLCAVFSLKILYWFFMDPSLYRAAMFGFKDYLAGRFYEGRGLQLVSSK